MVYNARQTDDCIYGIYVDVALDYRRQLGFTSMSSSRGGFKRCEFVQRYGCDEKTRRSV